MPYLSSKAGTSGITEAGLLAREEGVVTRENECVRIMNRVQVSVRFLELGSTGLGERTVGKCSVFFVFNKQVSVAIVYHRTWVREGHPDGSPGRTSLCPWLPDLVSREGLILSSRRGNGLHRRPYIFGGMHVCSRSDQTFFVGTQRAVTTVTGCRALGPALSTPDAPATEDRHPTLPASSALPNVHLFPCVGCLML